MTDPKVWGTSVKGNVYTLGASTSEWVQVRNQHNVLQGFKKVIASPMGAWALGCDHQVYIYVEKSDLPIRCQVSTYENERWLPTQGWGTKNLLPAVDPFDWSSEDGHVHLPKKDFKVASRSWEWEEEWRVDQNVQGFCTDQEGWRYSHIGFQSGFTHKKTFKSCVRRRKWIRYQRYTATDHWSKLASIHVDPLEEPIIDVTIGGYNFPNLDEGAASVWIITIDGKIVYRSGVSQKSPEGVSWIPVTLDEDDPDIVSISAGSTHLVWVVTWHGAVLARTGISWQNMKGSDWVQIPVPEGLSDKDRIVQVSVGHRTGWVVSSEGKVWFRKGISDEDAHGTGWLQMVDKMKMTAVIGQDKVMGIDIEDRQLYYRLGIGSEEQSGRSWQLLDLPFTLMRNHISDSMSSEISSFTDEGIDSNAASEKETESIKSIPGVSVSDILPSERSNSGGDHVEMEETVQKGSSEDTKLVLNNGIGTATSRSNVSANIQSQIESDRSIQSNNSSSSNLSGVRTSTSERDGFLSMGLGNEFSGLELNLEVEEEADTDTEGRRGFGCLTIDMDHGRTQEEMDEKAAGGDGSEKVDAQHPSIVWDESVAGKDHADESGPPKSKFVSFNRLRTNFGSRLKGPVEMINKLKSTNPKKMFTDLRHDIQDGKKEVFSVLSQAQEVFRHGKQESDADKIKVSFKKEGDMRDSENLELKFYDESSQERAVEVSEEMKTGKGVTDKGSNSVDKRSPQDVDYDSVSLSNAPTPSLATPASSVFGDDFDDQGHMGVLYVPAEQDIGDIHWSWVSGCFKQDVDEAKLKHWFYNDKGLYIYRHVHTIDSL